MLEQAEPDSDCVAIVVSLVTSHPCAISETNVPEMFMRDPGDGR